MWADEKIREAYLSFALILLSKRTSAAAALNISPCDHRGAELLVPTGRLSTPALSSLSETESALPPTVDALINTQECAYSTECFS